MNDLDAFEKELRALSPALPEPVSERLRQARSSVALKPAPATVPKPRFLSRQWYWWFAPATAVLIAGLSTWLAYRAPAPSNSQAAIPPNQNANATPAATSGGVEVASELVSDFESVTQLETGEPVRFRYMAYVDNITLEDPRSGVKWQQRSPRVEIVPVGFEIY